MVKDLMVLLDLLKYDKKLFDVLNVDEVLVLLEMLDLNKINGYCDCMMLEFLYVMGMCVFELIYLELENVNLIMGFVCVFGKGDKERIVLLGDVVIEYLIIYIEMIRL